MTISSAINAAQSGLQASSLRADLVATNIANASTPGYVRRSALLSENLLGGQSSGVLSQGVARNLNDVLTAQRRASSSDTALSDTLAKTRTELSRAFGDTADGSGFVSRISRLQDALSRAALSPESEAGLQDLAIAARSVVSEFQSLASLSDRLYQSADASILSAVDTVNQALATIETLNGKIAASGPGTNGAAGLLDERDRALDRLAEFMGVETIERAGGQIDVITTEGVYLLQGKARPIDISDDGNPNGPRAARLSVGGIELTPGVASFGALSTGRLAALFTVRDGELPGFAAKLATIATDLADRFATPGLDPTLAPGEPGLFSFIAGAPGSHDPGRLVLDARADPEKGGELFRLRDGLGAVSPGPAGQNTLLQAMADTLSSSRSLNQGDSRGVFNALELSAHTASLLGQARVSQNSTLAASEAVLQALSEAERSESGVNIDEQMQQLLLIEQSYAANARVIQAADDMIQRLLQL